MALWSCVCDLRHNALHFINVQPSTLFYGDYMLLIYFYFVGALFGDYYYACVSAHTPSAFAC